MALRQIAIGVATGVATVLAIDLVHMMRVKREAFDCAREMTNGKGIINLGAGPHRSFLAQAISESGEVMFNVDRVPDGMPHYMQLDLERECLPFSDRQFGCALLSHVLEHMDNWQFALSEAVRVADNVVVVLPHPASPAGWLSPEHRQHFSARDMEEIGRMFPSIRVFC